MRTRKSCVAVLFTLFALGLAVPEIASATTWKSVSPSAKFVKYAEHAHKHGMQAWYPRRIPTGFKLQSMKLGDTGTFGPYCDIVFAKGDKRMYLSQGTIVGADGDGPAPSGKVTWGGVKAEIFSGGWITWWGTKTDFAQLSGKGVTSSEKRYMAKYMRKVK